MKRYQFIGKFDHTNDLIALKSSKGFLRFIRGLHCPEIDRMWRNHIRVELVFRNNKPVFSPCGHLAENPNIRYQAIENIESLKVLEYV